MGGKPTNTCPAAFLTKHQFIHCCLADGHEGDHKGWEIRKQDAHGQVLERRDWPRKWRGNSGTKELGRGAA